MKRPDDPAGHRKSQTVGIHVKDSAVSVVVFNFPEAVRWTSRAVKNQENDPIERGATAAI